MKNNCVDYLIKLFEEAVKQLYKLREAARNGILPPFDFLPEKTAAELTTAHLYLQELWKDGSFQKEYEKILHRNRTRRWRARKKQAQEPVTMCGEKADIYDGNAAIRDGSVTVCDENVTPGDGFVTACDATVAACDASVTERDENVTPGDASAKKEKENEKRKKQRKEINKNKKIFKTNIADAMPNSARAREEEPKAKMAELFAETDCAVTETQPENGNASTEGNCLPWQPPKKKTQVLIPTAELPDVYRKIVSAWNQLPLTKKFSGLYPSLVKRLHFLLENYGEEQIHKAINSISDSPFLLGKSKNNRGWVVSLNWMLEPEHFEKILGGEYHDDKSSNSSGFFQIGDELKPLPEGFIGTVVY